MPYRAPVHRPTRGTTSSKAERDAAYNARRGSSCAAGYDRDWQKARLAHLAREPLCRFCAARGLVVEAVAVDHIAPLQDRPDLRLVDSNLRSLCTPCHNAHTMQQLAAKRRGG